MRELRCHELPIEFRQEGDGPATISGHAAVYYDGTERTEFDMFGMFRERIMPGAFDDVLSSDVRCLLNHDPNMLLGRTTAGTLKLNSDDVGLRFRATLPDTAAGRDVKTLVGRGDLQGCSFSFTVAGEREFKEGGVWYREVTAVKELYDVGPVTFPAYDATDVQSNCRDLVKAWQQQDIPARPQGRSDRDRLAMRLRLLRCR